MNPWSVTRWRTLRVSPPAPECGRLGCNPPSEQPFGPKVVQTGGDSPQNAPLRNTKSFRCNSDQGLWPERTLRFDATLLKPGENEMAFAVPGGDLQSLDFWDYLQLEPSDKHLTAGKA